MTSLAADARMLVAMVRGLPSRGSHAERLAAFYAPQAQRYDRFRDRLLHGREELIAMLPIRRGDHLVELGGGTGCNAERLGPRLAKLARYTVVDLCQPLLARARVRADRLPALHVEEGDATTWTPSCRVDCVLFSYSLTMIPDWQRAIDNAIAMVRPGGVVAAVDFYVGREHPAPGMALHGWWTRTAWPRWFRHDGVHLGPERLDYLRSRLVTTCLAERFGDVPYLPGLRVPHYLFVGRREQRAASNASAASANPAEPQDGAT